MLPALAPKFCAWQPGLGSPTQPCLAVAAVERQLGRVAMTLLGVGTPAMIRVSQTSGG